MLATPREHRRKRWLGLCEVIVIVEVLIGSALFVSCLIRAFARGAEPAAWVDRVQE